MAMNSHLTLILQASVLVYWFGKTLNMCPSVITRPRPTSVEDWLDLVPCPPPNRFSLLCSEVPDCDLLLKILDVCLSQYSLYFNQSFTDEIKCSEKGTCEATTACNVSEKINVSCQVTEDSTTITTEEDYVTMTSSKQWTSSVNSRKPSISSRTTSQTTTYMYHVTELKSTLLSITIEHTDNTSLMTNVSISNISTELEHNVHGGSTVISVVVFLVLVIVVVILVFRIKQKYDVNVRPLFPTRQISTSSQTPMLRSDKGCNILCLTLKRRITSREKTGHQSTMETPVNHYSAVPMSEPPCFEDGEKGDGKNDYECMETALDLSVHECEACTVENYEEDKEVKEICTNQEFDEVKEVKEM